MALTKEDLQKLGINFTPIETLVAALQSTLSEVQYKARLPDLVEKFSVDLTTARNNQKLSTIGGGERLFNYDPFHPSWFYLKLLVKGTGTWTLTFIQPGTKTGISLLSSEMIVGDDVNLEFTELEFTNTAQPGLVNPTFWLEKRTNFD